MSQDLDVREIEEVVPEVGSRPKVSKLEQKRRQIFEQRVQRHVSSGMNVEDAIARVQKEDYDVLPVSEKIKHLEGMLIGNIQKLAEDITLLRQNQTMLANVMDANFKAFDKMLGKLGLSEDERKKLVEEAIMELHAERANSPSAPVADGSDMVGEDHVRTEDVVSEPGS